MKLLKWVVLACGIAGVAVAAIRLSERCREEPASMVGRVPRPLEADAA
jgi:hypothetical protein